MAESFNVERELLAGFAKKQMNYGATSNHVSKKVMEGQQQNNGLISGQLTDDPSDRSDESVADFLIRIDSEIAKAKDNANKIMQQNRLTGTYSADDLLRLRSDTVSEQASHLRRQSSTSANPSSRNSVNNYFHTNESGIPMQPIVKTQGRRVQSSLQRLERQQDELFEL